MAPIPIREVGNSFAIGNVSASGPVGLAPKTVDNTRVLTIAQTTLGLTLTLPTPTDVIPIFTIHVVNVGTASFMMGSQPIGAGLAGAFTWTGSAWVSGAPASKTLPTYTVATLPATGNNVGDEAYATNGRAYVYNLAGLGLTVTQQAPGLGTGVSCTWGGSAWQVSGTANAVVA